MVNVAVDEAWQTALLIVGLVVFLIISAFVYYRTSDQYRLAAQRKRLGYDDPDDSVCFLFAPAVRRKWERDHKVFRTDDYAPYNGREDWRVIKAKNQPGEEWQNLPRGDDHGKRKVLSRAVAKVKATLINGLIDEAIEQLVKELEQPTIERIDQKRRRRTEADVLRIDEQDRLALLQEEESAAQEIIREEEDMARAMMRGVISVAPKAKDEVVYASLAFAGRKSKKVKNGMNTVTRLRSFTKPLGMDVLKSIASGSYERAELTRQFHDIPLNTPKVQYPEDTLPMNRVSGVVPQPHTRVKVERSTGSDYINANYIRGPDGQPHRFIATQSPLSGSERGKVSTQEAFWSMVWTHYVQAVVMLCGTEPYETSQYWPTQATAVVRIGKYAITFGGERAVDGIVITKLILYRQGTDQERTLTHFRVTCWPELGLPPVDVVMRLLNEVAKINKTSAEPVIVHCNNGIGRTGTLIAIDHGRYQIKNKKQADILAIIAAIREDRGGMVESLQQFDFVHSALAHYATGSAELPKYVDTPKFDDDEAPAYSSEEEKEETALAIALDNETLNDRRMQERLEKEKRRAPKKSIHNPVDFDAARREFAGYNAQPPKPRAQDSSYQVGLLSSRPGDVVINFNQYNP